jgi:pilus assembly protein CpaB
MASYIPPRGFDNGHKSPPPPKQTAKIAIGVFSLCFIAIISIVIQNSGQSANNQPNILGQASNSQIGTVTLFKVGRPINAGEVIPAAEVKEVYWAVNQVPEGAIRDRAELKNMYAKVAIPGNSPLQLQQLMDKPVASSLPVTPGNRAVSIEIDATSGIEGQALPGTFVDVVLTYHLNSVLKSKVIVQNTRVLSLQGSTKSVGEIDPAVKKGIPMAAQTITLDVSPRDALAITTSRQLGRLSLMMRYPGDDTVLDVDELDQNDFGEKSLVDNVNIGSRPITSANKCIKGRYQINGKDYLLDCDNNSTLLNQGEDDFS